MVKLSDGPASPPQFDLRDGKGTTPMHLAAMSGNAELVRFLISMGLKTSDPDDAGVPVLWGLTPFLHWI
jgi:ankyrin repeat protein